MGTAQRAPGIHPVFLSYLVLPSFQTGNDVKCQMILTKPKSIWEESKANILKYFLNDDIVQRYIRETTKCSIKRLLLNCS